MKTQAIQSHLIRHDKSSGHATSHHGKKCHVITRQYKKCHVITRQDMVCHVITHAILSQVTLRERKRFKTRQALYCHHMLCHKMFCVISCHNETRCVTLCHSKTCHVKHRMAPSLHLFQTRWSWWGNKRMQQPWQCKQHAFSSVLHRATTSASVFFGIYRLKCTACLRSLGMFCLQN